MPHTKLNHFTNMYAGKTIYIVGCGPSLWNWSSSSFAEFPTIFINSSIHYTGNQIKYPDDHYRIFMDVNCINKYFGRPYYKKSGEFIPNVHTFTTFHMLSGMDAEQKKILNALNTTCYYCFEDKINPFRKIDYLWQPTLFSAINLAGIMGAKEIRLAGVDYGCESELTHWDGVSGSKKACCEWGDYTRGLMLNLAFPLITRMGMKLKQFASPRKEIGIGVRPYE